MPSRKRLSSFIFNHPRWVVAVWMAALGFALIPAGALSDRVSNGGYDVPGSQSQEIEQLNAERFEQGEHELLYVAVRSNESPPSPARVRHIVAALRKAPGLPGIEVFAPRSGSGIALVPFLVPGSFADVQKRVADLRQIVSTANGEAQVLGEAAVWDEASSTAEKDLSRAETLALPLTLLVLLVAFLSVIAAGLPIMLALVSLVVAFAALSLLGTTVDLSIYVTNTASVLMLGLAIDYSLFIITRYRELRAQNGGDLAGALEETLRTTGRAILLSGVTIALGLSSLAVIGVGVFTSMAIGASIAAAIAALGALTFVPAVLCLLGARIDRLQLHPLARAAQSARLWKGLARRVLARPWLVLSGTVLLLALCALPLTGSRLIYPSGYTLLPESNELRKASSATERAFSPGTLDQLDIATDAPARGALTAVRRVPGVASASLAGRSGRLVRIVVTPTMPGNTPAADDLVRRLRSQLPTVTGARVVVGGDSARGLDLIDRIKARFPWMIAVACALSFLLLLVAFRSLVVPAKAIATNLLSVAATLGLVALLFEGLGSSGGIAWFVPPFLFAIVFGLSMDYEIFLLSRVRDEHLAGASNEEAITRALVRNARPITLAALVMMIVFLAFALAQLETFRQLGVGMAIAVFLDATVVRCALVPAALALLGERNWWMPSPLGRLLPTVSPKSERAAR
jgi:RND superfamily putative drug exporter